MYELKSVVTQADRMGKRMDINEIVQLMERFDASKATRLQLKSGDTELVLESAPVQTVYAQPTDAGNASQPMTGSSVTVVQQAAPGKGNVIASDNAGTEKKLKAAEAELNGVPVKAPLVGTFYCAPSPEDKPFVTVGQQVKKGDVIGIIEAMKLMNEITAPEDGVVKNIFAQNGNMVEYGEVLMVLE